MPDLQVIFDRCATHLLTQNAKSMAEEWDDDYPDMCAYRGKDNLRCAVGALIADEHYDPTFEGKGVFDAGVSQALKLSGYDVASLPAASLLAELQELHDTAPVEEWALHLSTLAQKFELDDTVIDTALHERNTRIQEAANAI